MRCPFCMVHELQNSAWIDLEYGGIYKSHDHYDCANCGPVAKEHVDAVVARIKELEALVSRLEDEARELFSQLREWA